MTKGAECGYFGSLLALGVSRAEKGARCFSSFFCRRGFRDFQFILADYLIINYDSRVCEKITR